VATAPKYMHVCRLLRCELSIPNFFIAGAPRCGTTALYEYLRTHPNVFLPCIKEPHFFVAAEYPRYKTIAPLDKYLKLFDGVTDKHLAIGEASIHYLYLSYSLPKIYQFNKNAKIIVMLRNPIDLVYSYHHALRRIFYEDVENFEEAWQLQTLRKQEQRIPRLCGVPAFLQYADIGRLGMQVEYLLRIFPREQVELVLFDEFRTSTKTVYEKILSFLNVPPDGRIDFPRINENRDFRVRWFAKILSEADPLIEILRQTLGFQHTGIMRAVHELNFLSSHREPLSPAFRQELVEEFREDVDRLSQILGKDLQHWHS
jgi:hypothetical protein